MNLGSGQTPRKYVHLDLSVEGWWMQIAENLAFPGTMTLVCEIFAPDGTVFVRRSGGGGTSWLFEYRSDFLSFEFSCSKLNGSELRDVGSGQATAHQLGPNAILHVRSNDELFALSELQRLEVFEDLMQFIGVISRHWPNVSAGKGMPLRIDKDIEFLKQLPSEAIDRMLLNLGGDILPVFSVKLWRGSPFEAGIFAFEEGVQ